MDQKCERLLAGTQTYNARGHQLTERFLKELEQEARLPAALCMGDWEVLDAAVHIGGKPSMARIARALKVNPSSVSRSVRRLQENGLLAKAADPADERGFLVTPTQEGTAFHAALSARLGEVLRQMLTGVSEEQLSTVFAFSDHCTDFLRNLLNK